MASYIFLPFWGISLIGMAAIALFASMVYLSRRLKSLEESAEDLELRFKLKD